MPGGADKKGNDLKMLKFNEKIKKSLSVEFNYSESCRNVYKSVGYAIDGRSTNLTGAKKFFDSPENIPGIIRANTYFWTPGGNTSARRSNERYRENEVKDWLKSEGFMSEINLNKYFTGRRRGENIGADGDGYFFEKFGERYHWEKFREVDIKKARREIVRRVKISKQIKKINRILKLNPEKLVTFRDSVAAGNCKIGTEQFATGALLQAARKRLPGVRELKAVSVGFLLSVRDDRFTRRAVAVALNR